MMDGIEVFVEVVRSRSFRLAAQRLRMPAATVSAKIARLEQRLGTTLIQRSTRRFHVTEKGRAYVTQCQRAVEEMQQAQQVLKAQQAEPAGVLHVSAPVDLGRSLLPEIAEAYLTQYPRMRLELTVTNRVVDLLAEGIDVAIRAGKLRDSRLVARKLLSGHLRLWTSPAYVERAGLPRRPEDLAKHAFVTMSMRGLRSISLRNGSKSLTLPNSSRIVCDDLSTVRQFVVRGYGIAALPDLVGLDDGLIPVLPAFRSDIGQVSIVYPEQKYVAPELRAFVDCALQVVRRRPHVPQQKG